MKTITSLQNSEIKEIVKLHNSRRRYETQQFIAEGLRTIQTLIQNKTELIKIYVTESLLDEVKKLIDENFIALVSDQVLAKMSLLKTPSGMLAVFQIPQMPAYHLLSSGIVLANVSDPGNMGTLIRTCAALNIKSVVIVEGADPYNPKVVQASAGTIGQVNIFSMSWHELLEHKGKLKLFALVVSGGKKPESIDSKNALLVIGSESHGIPEQWIADCDEKITIPMPGNIESLNAAVAGSIAAYQIFNR